jgi:hypothetical protein
MQRKNRNIVPEVILLLYTVLRVLRNIILREKENVTKLN